MKKIMGPEEAKHQECCVMPKKCVGIKCMAWRQHVVETPVEIEDDVQEEQQGQLRAEDLQQQQPQPQPVLGTLSRKERRAQLGKLPLVRNLPVPKIVAAMPSIKSVEVKLEVTDKGYCGMIPN